jgi:hypothetical protein
MKSILEPIVVLRREINAKLLHTLQINSKIKVLMAKRVLA